MMDPTGLYYLPPPGRRGNAFAQFVHNYTATVSPYAMQTYAAWLQSLGPAEGLLRLEDIITERMKQREESLRNARSTAAQRASSQSGTFNAIVSARTNLATTRTRSQTDLAVARTNRDVEALKAGALTRPEQRQLLSRGEAVISQGQRKLEQASRDADERGQRDAIRQMQEGLTTVLVDAERSMDGNELDTFRQQLESHARAASVAAGGGTGGALRGDTEASAALLGAVQELTGSITARDRRDYGAGSADPDSLIQQSMRDAQLATALGLGGSYGVGGSVGGSGRGGGQPDTYITPDDLNMDELRNQLMEAQRLREQQLRELFIRQTAPGILNRRQRRQDRATQQAMAELGLEGQDPGEVLAALRQLAAEMPADAPADAPAAQPQPDAEPAAQVEQNVGQNEVAPAAPPPSGAMRPPRGTQGSAPTPVARPTTSPTQRSVSPDSPVGLGARATGRQEFTGPPNIYEGQPAQPAAQAEPRRPRQPIERGPGSAPGPSFLDEVGPPLEAAPEDVQRQASQLSIEQAQELDQQTPDARQLNQMMRDVLQRQRAGETVSPQELALLRSMMVTRKLVDEAMEREGVRRANEFRQSAPAPGREEAPPADPAPARGAPAARPSSQAPQDAWPDLSIRPMGSRAPAPAPPQPDPPPISSAERQQRMMDFHGTDLPNHFYTSPIQVPEIEPPQPLTMSSDELERERIDAAQGQLLMQLLHGQDATRGVTEADRLATANALANQFSEQLRRIQEERRKMLGRAAGPSGAGTNLRPTE